MNSFRALQLKLRQESTRKLGNNRRRLIPELLAFEERIAMSTFTVTNTADSGAGSLRDAINQANNTPINPSSNPNNVIVFDSTAFAKPTRISIQSDSQAAKAAFVITNSVTIQGPGAQLTIDGGGAFRVFDVKCKAQLTIDHLDIQNGYAGDSLDPTEGDNGGGLNVEAGGSAFVTDCTFQACRATLGGAAYVEGSLTMADCSLVKDSASVFGGGILGTGTNSLVTLQGSTFENDVAQSSGAFNIYQGNAMLSDCTFRDNLATTNAPGYLGGGAMTLNQSVVTLDRCIIENNISASDGGGVSIPAPAPAGAVIFDGCTIAGNVASGFGGGFSIGAGANGTARVSITNSRIVGNRARYMGGGMNVVDGAVVLGNDLFTKNFAGLDGGRINILHGSITGSGDAVVYNMAGKSGGGFSIFGGTISLNRAKVHHKRVGNSLHFAKRITFPD
jgi:hypothetical protein